MPKIIVISCFIRAGNHSKLNNYVKYIATREGVELTEQNNVQQLTIVLPSTKTSGTITRIREEVML